jgi:putative membrane protein
MIRISIWLYVIVFSLSLSEQMSFLATPFVFLTGTVFHLVYEARRMLVDPFEGHPNDVPMSSIVRTIEINLLEGIGEPDLPPRVEPVGHRYLM